MFAATSLAPTDTGLVQQAQAKQSKATKAKKAYKKFLSGSKYKWAVSYESWSDEWRSKNPASYRFALKDVNGDKVPELMVENTETYYAAGYGRLYTFYKGKVKLASRLSNPYCKVNKKAHVLYYQDQHTGAYWGEYYKLKKGKLVEKASWIGEDMKPTSYGHHAAPKIVRHGAEKTLWAVNGLYFTSDSYKVNGKKTSYKKYKRYVSKLTKHHSKATSFKFHKNTAKNRTKYLK